MSNDDLSGLLIAIAFLATFAVHIYYLVGAIYRRRWQFLAKIGGSFAIYLLAIVLSFGVGVGLCAAGCPRDLDALLGLFWFGLSIVVALRLRQSHRRLIEGSTPTRPS